MTNKDIYRSLGGIDPELIENAARATKIKKGMKWRGLIAVAAALLLVVGVVVAVPMLQEDDPTIIPRPNESDSTPGFTDCDTDKGTNDIEQDPPEPGTDRYKDIDIVSEECMIVWEWEDMTVYEKYASVNVNGTEFSGKGRELSSDYVGDKLGSYTATGYDNVYGYVYNDEFDAYTIKGVSPEKLIAVKLEDKYYVYVSQKYDPPKTFGGVLDNYLLSEYVELSRFSCEGNGIEDNYRVLVDDEYIWEVLENCESSKMVNPTLEWHENRGNYISFTVTSEALGIYKNAMYVTESGYVWTNALFGEYLYFIGEEAAEKIIKYAIENSTQTVFEPYNKTVSGNIVEITDEYILVDDSILCKDPKDGVVFKVLISDARVSRYFDKGLFGVGEMIVVTYEGKIDTLHENTIDGAISISSCFISDGQIVIPE